MTEPDLRLRAVVPAPPKVVYEALTDPAALRVWLAEHADVDLPGKYEFWGRFTPDGAEPHQRVLQVDERTIRFGWTVSGVESEVGFELAEDEDGTLVTLTHSDLPTFAEVLADTWHSSATDHGTTMCDSRLVLAGTARCSQSAPRTRSRSWTALTLQLSGREMA